MIRRLSGMAIGVVVASIGFAGVAHADATSPTVTAAPGTPIIAGHTEFDLKSGG